ncbi:BCCT family transporter [Photobacterium phosphoreum]|uniref:BCCT family transporter n=1 Tax=Photobacterium phosphoreum TaxID=659 RepID=UPI000D17BA2D|nr:BCCT family transporter [Photobacterium phosphoreum]PTB32713.1 hypothetical protein DAT36_09845 [Photobacterium phosphoreum]
MSEKPNTITSDPIPRTAIEKLELLNPVMWLSGGFIALFIVTALYDKTLLTTIVNSGFAWAITFFGPYWQVLLLLTFLIGIALAIGKTGGVILGNLVKPEIDNFRWVAILLCTLLAGGGVFWAAAEPIAHYITVQPLFGDPDNTWQRAVNALAQSFMHWGFLAWAITQHLPFPTLVSILFLILTTIFIVTTGDSMTYTISVVISGDTEPNAFIQTFWGIMMGLTAIILISFGSGGISALQSFIVITAVPVSLILLWDAPRLAAHMAKQQGL